MDLAGNNYEGIEIPPDVDIGYSRNTQEFLTKVVTDLEKSGESAIETTLEHLKNR